MKTNELKKFSNNLSANIAASFWQQLSETSFTEMAVDAQAITRDSVSKRAIREKDESALLDSISPTLIRLRANSSIDGLYVFGHDKTLLFKNGGHNIDLTNLISETMQSQKQHFVSILNAESKSLYFAYAFPVYFKRNMVGVVVYIKDVEPLLENFSAVSGLDYGVLYEGDLFFNNFAFDEEAYDDEQSSILYKGAEYSLIKVKLSLDNSDNTFLIIAAENTDSLRALNILNIGSILVPILALFIIIFSLYFIIKGISSVLIQSVESMKQLAEQNFDITVPEYKRKDEIGKLISMLSILKEKLQYTYELEQKEKIAQQKEIENAQTLLLATQDVERAFSELSTYMQGINQHAMVSVTDKSGIIIEVNDKFCQSSGYKKEELIGQKHSILKSDIHPQAFFVNMWKTIKNGNIWSGEVCNKSKQGRLYWVDTSIVPLKNDEGVIERYISIRIDITERKKTEKRIIHMGTHDELTGLPNRILLQDRIKQALAHDRRTGTYAAVLFIDLDQFKIINDSIGHDIGDLLLVDVASRLLSCVREEDTVARQGGDEFIILLPNIPDPKHAEIVGNLILESIIQPYEIRNHELHVSASIGISIFPDDGMDANVLMKNSDTAMYHAKEHGRNNCRLFKPEMNAMAEEKHILLSMLRRAINNNEFELHYQPIVNIESGKIVSMEALIRWNQPEKGFIPPLDFIELAEQSGLIVPIGEWVLKTGAMQMKEWLDQGYDVPQIAINLSVRQFYQKDLVKILEDILKSYSIDGSRLELEITESILMENTDELIATMHRIKAMGIKISVDDFGTGYSSLSYIKSFPIDTLKIDRSFVADIETNAGDAAIVKTIIALAHSLKLEVIAEGVENEGQLNFLAKQNCDNFQGYHYSRPLPASEIIQKLHRLKKTK